MHCFKSLREIYVYQRVSLLKNILVSFTMLRLKNISFCYDKDAVLKNIDLNIPQGHHVSVIGRSGCGKSTLLKIIYGLYTPLSGSIERDGAPLLGPDFNIIPGENFMKYVAQDFDLMPFISAKQNVGKYLSNFYPEEKEHRTSELLETVQMTNFADIKPKYLSGGQQQRIAIARALAKEPEILLLDEPFSHIDNFQKNSLRRNLFSYLKSKNITCIVATHDSTDALSFADNTVVLEDGNIVAEGNPQTLFNSPPNRYTASLFGDINVLPSSIFTSEKPVKDIYIHPHELNVHANGVFQVIVKRSFFKGNCWLIEAGYQDKSIFFEHTSLIHDNCSIRLNLSEEILRKRLRS
jgi:iron(III) transport system ATP-binding protein